MALPWHKLNRKKQNQYIILVAMVVALIISGLAFLINIH